MLLLTWGLGGGFREQLGVGHCVGHVNNESGVVHVVGTKLLLFDEIS